MDVGLGWDFECGVSGLRRMGCRSLRRLEFRTCRPGSQNVLRIPQVFQGRYGMLFREHERESAKL